MDRSERIEELAMALAQAQGEFKPAQKSGKNPHLRNRYATLDDIIEAVRPGLSAHGLSFLQLLDGASLTTILLHESGQWIKSSTDIDALDSNRGTNEMQAFGATLTYLKRYALAAMLGVSSDEDVDGNVPQRKQPQRRSQEQEEPAEEEHWIDDDATRRKFWAWCKDTLALSEPQVYEALEVEHIHDFVGSKESARDKIENWVSEQIDDVEPDMDNELVAEALEDSDTERLGIDVRARK